MGEVVIAFLGAALLLIGLFGATKTNGPRWIAACVLSGIGSGLLGWGLA